MIGEEWAVMDDLGSIGMMGRTWPTLQGAEWGLAWIMEHRAEREQAAKEEQESGFAKGTNEATYYWNKEKDRTYRIVRRTITPWEDA